MLRILIYLFFTKRNRIPVLFIFICMGLLLLPMRGISQEIDARVTVDRSQLSNTSLSFLDNLSDEIESYINEYNWTDTDFKLQERIRLDLQITLMSTDDNFNFNAQVVVQSRRPIYNTPRETMLFFHNDENWTFNYTPNRSLRHDLLQFDTLTSFIDFYVYIVLGYDFDSFEELAGTPYFSEAQNILSQAQNSSATGWDSNNNRRNRAQLVSNLLSSNYESLRSAIYEYHRLGLDRFVDHPKEARQQIIATLQKIDEAKSRTSSNFLFDIFFNTKYRELVFIFEDAEPQVRRNAFEVLSTVDQSHLSEYRKLQ
ncbi:hypothetical protein Asal01_01395 [Fodinibius salicampi]